MRNIYDVINQMLVKVPTTQEYFARNLKKIGQDTFYTAPECMIDLWYDLSIALYAAFGEVPKEDWQWEVANILMDRPIDCRESVEAKD